MLTVMTANLQRAYFKLSPYHWERRKHLIFQLLDEISPHILCTQELTQNAIDEITQKLPHLSYSGEGRFGGRKGEYVAIFYDAQRVELLNEGTFWLSHKPDKKGSRGWMSFFPCICSWGEFQDKLSGEIYKVFNTHLDHISPMARLHGLRIIREHMEDNCCNNDKIIIAGDFNAPPHSKALRKFTSTEHYNLIFYQAVKEGRTFHGLSKKEQGSPIDYIFTSQNIRIREAYILKNQYEGKYISDHHPLIAVIES